MVNRFLWFQPRFLKKWCPSKRDRIPRWGNPFAYLLRLLYYAFHPFNFFATAQSHYPLLNDSWESDGPTIFAHPFDLHKPSGTETPFVSDTGSNSIRLTPKVSEDKEPLPSMWRGSIQPAEGATPRRPYSLLMYEYELRLCVGNAVAKYPNESPMSIFGLQRQCGDLVAQLAIPPGLGAVEEFSYCQHSLEYFQQASTFLKRHFGLDFIIDIHSHGRHDLPEASRGDYLNLSTLARRNNLGLLGEVIITVDKKSPPGDESKSELGENWVKTGHETDDYCRGLFRRDLHPVVNPFVLRSLENGEYDYQPATLLLLGEKSPFRYYLEQQGLEEMVGLEFDNDPYPLEMISIRRLLRFDEPDNSSTQPPQVLLNQVNQLPKETIRLTEVFKAEHMWVVRVPVIKSVLLHCIFGENPQPGKIEHIFLKFDQGDIFIDLSILPFLTRDVSSISDIYRRVVQFISENGINSLRQMELKGCEHRPYLSSDTTKQSV